MMMMGASASSYSSPSSPFPTSYGVAVAGVAGTVAAITGAVAGAIAVTVTMNCFVFNAQLQFPHDIQNINTTIALFLCFVLC